MEEDGEYPIDDEGYEQVHGEVGDPRKEVALRGEGIFWQRWEARVEQSCVDSHSWADSRIVDHHGFVKTTRWWRVFGGRAMPRIGQTRLSLSVLSKGFAIKARRKSLLLEKLAIADGADGNNLCAIKIDGVVVLFSTFAILSSALDRVS